MSPVHRLRSESKYVLPLPPASREVQPRVQDGICRAVVRADQRTKETYVKLVRLGERVTREVVHPRMSHETAVELTGRPRCRPLVRMLCKKVKSKTKC